jgi:hypothetical protein
MSANYNTHFIHMAGSCDLITFETFPSDSFTPDQISEFKTNPQTIPIDWIIQRISDTSTVIYKVESAYELFINQPLLTHKPPLNPFNRQLIPPVFISRIKLYHDVIKHFGSDYVVNYEEIKTLFHLYLNEESLTSEQMLLIRRFVRIDDIIDIFGSILIDSLETRGNYRSIAQDKLSNQPLGSWLIRPSSIKDNPETGKIVRVCSYKTATKIQDILILHINGIGYMYNIVFDRFGSIQTFDYNKFILINSDFVFESIVDILESIKHIIKLNKYIRE